MTDLRGALLNSGLVSQEQAAKIDEEKRAQEERKWQLTEKQASDREFDQKYAGWFEKKPQYYFWMKEQKVPLDAKDRCCICGKKGHSLKSSVLKVWDSLSPKNGENVLEPLYQTKQLADKEYKLILWHTNGFLLACYPELQKIWPPNTPLMICGEDRMKISEMFGVK